MHLVISCSWLLAAVKLHSHHGRWLRKSESVCQSISKNSFSNGQLRNDILLGSAVAMMSSSDADGNGPVLDRYEDSHWKDLPVWVQEAATILGYSKTIWDKGGEPPSNSKPWSQLTLAEQEAAISLGYNAERWEDDSDSDDDAETGPRVIFCVQLYSETADYKLQIDDLKGLSMFANRPMAADEIIFQALAGPPCPMHLFQASKSNDDLSPERRSFAERFLEWQGSYGKSGSVGITEDRPVIDLDDFSNPPSHDIRSHFPTKEQPTYEFKELCENDIVLVEFVPNEKSSYSLPPDRRFEILPFDECIAFYGEEDYSPERCQRPPTMFGKTSRGLEIPGHFSNHACGSTATVYDTYRLASNGADTTSGECPLVAPAQPAWVQRKLEEFVKTHKFPDVFPCNTMTTRRALEPGEEITTDYAIWHWSNEDYIPNGPSYFNPAIRSMPEEVSKEDADWMEPWFECVCGDAKCHSSSGFRGVRHFPLEEQKRLYWSFSPWVQQQLDWKFYQLSKETETYRSRQEPTSGRC